MRRLPEEISADVRFWFFAALMLLTVPIRWILAAFIAAMVHELGHVAAVYLVDGEISRVRFSLHGVCIESCGISVRQELICVLAGPASSLLLICLVHSFPRVAICGVIQGIYNLIPIHSRDGENALRCIRALR